MASTKRRSRARGANRIDARYVRWSLPRFVVSGLLSALSLVLFMQWIGLDEGVDSRLRELFYKLRGERSSQKRVLLVEVDDASINRLGPLPWPQEHYVDLSRQIHFGNPRAIAFVEPSAMVWARDTEDRDTALEGILMPPVHPSRTDEPRYLGTERKVASLPLKTSLGAPTLFARLIREVGLSLPDAERLPINYLGPGVQAPVLSAVSVIDGNISPQAFNDKIVLVGRAHTETAMSLPTPVGAMTLAEIHAHALLAVDDGVTWWQPASEWIWLFIAFYAAVLMLVMYRRTVRTLFTTLSVCTLGPVVAGYVGFASGAFLVSVADSMLTALAAFAVAFVVSEADGRVRLASLAHEVTRSVTSDGPSDDRFWLRVSRLAELYTDAESSMLAEVTPATAELEIHALTGAGAKDIVEKNRNVRNPPFRQAYNTKLLDTVDGFMGKELGLHTVLVPLIIKREVIGFWILNFKDSYTLETDAESLITLLAEQIAHSLARRREGSAGRARRGVSATQSRDTLTATVDHVDRGMRNILLERRLTSSMLEDMPVGMVTAAPWLDIELTNHKMQEILGDANIKLAELDDLAGLLVRLTGKDRTDVDDQIRRVVETKSKVTFTIADSEYAFTLNWVHAANRDGGTPLARLLLTASQGADDSDEHSTEAGAFDVRPVIMQALNLMRVAPDIPDRTVRIDLVDPMPRARGNPQTTQAALLTMLRDTALHGSPEMPCTLAVECEEDQIIITVSDPTYSIPASAVEALLRQSGQSDDTQSSLAAIQRRLQDHNGHIEVDSFYGSGIVFRLQLSLET